MTTGPRDDALGISLYLGWWHEPAELEPLAAAARDAGVRWLREPMPWEVLEPSPGREDVERFELGLQVAVEHGFRVMAQIGAPPAWAAQKPGGSLPRLDAWAQFLRRMVERYGDRIDAWEIGNEPNFPVFWLPEPAPDEYAAFLTSAHSAIKSVDSDAVVVAMSTSGADVAFMEAVLRAGGDVATEAVAIHPYTAAEGPEAGDQTGKLEETIALLRRWGLAERVWLTELGWGTSPTDATNGVSLDTQADYLVRGYALARAVPGVERLFWFCGRDFVQPQPADWPPEWEYTRYYGLLDRDLQPKPALATCRVLTEEVGGMEFAERVASPPGTHVLRFAGADRGVAVCWSESGSRPLRIAEATGAVTVTGNAAAVDGGGTVTVTGSPLFVRIGRRDAP